MYSQIEDAPEGKRLSSSSSFDIPCYNIFMSSEFGKFLIVVGIALVLVGLVVFFRVQIPYYDLHTREYCFNVCILYFSAIMSHAE